MVDPEQSVKALSVAVYRCVGLLSLTVAHGCAADRVPCPLRIVSHEIAQTTRHAGQRKRRCVLLTLDTATVNR